MDLYNVQTHLSATIMIEFCSIPFLWEPHIVLFININNYYPLIVLFLAQMMGKGLFGCSR